MKNIVFSIVAFLFATGYCSAQDHSSDHGSRLMLGVKVGANYSNVYDAQGEEFKADPKFGLAFGAFLAIPIMRFIGVQPEVLFSQKGYKATGRLLGTNYEMTRTTNYIDVPILISLRPIQSFAILVGPHFSYLLKSKDNFTAGNINLAQEQEFKNENLRKNTLGFTGGIDFTMNHFVLGLRAAWDIKNNNGDGTATTPRYKNAWYQATVGFGF